MPPKKAGGPSKKTEQKKKEKVIEDKTFGLKNKKGTKQQKFIQQVTKQVTVGNQKASQSPQQTELQKKKDAERKKKEELNMLFNPVQQSISKGADPKSVLCAFFKQGACGKGAKCKFSHDLAVERKSEKRGVYEQAEEKDAMDDWDDEKLAEVVNQKHGQKNKSLPPTSIICKHFLDALETSKYGWFWECPGGERCHYRHALPPGYVLKKDKKKLDEQTETVSLEELVERERAALGSELTKVTFETFLVWKAKKRAERIKKDKVSQDKKKTAVKAGAAHAAGVSGRDLFTFNPELALGDDDEADEVIVREVEEEEDVEEGEEKIEIKEIDLTEFAYNAGKQAAPHITAEISVDTGDRFADINYLTNGKKAETAVGQEDETKDTSADEKGKMDQAAAPEPVSDTDAAIAAAMAATIDGEIPIDENLFDGDDLDEIDEDLDNLEL